MKVYVITQYDYDGVYIHRVYGSSAEAALEVERVRRVTQTDKAVFQPITRWLQDRGIWSVNLSDWWCKRNGIKAGYECVSWGEYEVR